MRQYLTLLFVALIVPPALADDMKTPNSKTIVMCFEQQSLGAICARPCTGAVSARFPVLARYLRC